MKHHKWTAKEDKLLTKGIPVAKLAERLGLSTSQVYGRIHVLGKKKKGFSTILVSTDLTAGQKAARTRKINQAVREFKVPELDKPFTGFKYTINGISIRISGDAKEVIVNKDHIKVEF